MVQMTPALMRRSKIMAATKRIVNYSNAGFYQVLSAEVATKHGLNVSGLVFDVSMEVRNALSVGTDANGGYTVPDEFHRQMVEALEENKVFSRTLPSINSLSLRDSS